MVDFCFCLLSSRRGAHWRHLADAADRQLQRCNDATRRYHYCSNLYETRCGQQDKPRVFFPANVLLLLLLALSPVVVADAGDLPVISYTGWAKKTGPQTHDHNSIKP